MELKPIKSKRDYKAALEEAEALWTAKPDTPQADRLEVLTLLIADYEAKHYPIPDPDPIDFLHYVIETRGLTRKDLEPHIGSRGRVAEILNRTRPLTLEMVRRLSEGLNIPADVMIQKYPLRRIAA